MPALGGGRRGDHGETPSYQDATGYNNFTSSAPTKADPAATHTLKTGPGRWRWRVWWPGRGLDIDELLKLSPQEGAHLPPALRGGWSMGHSWVGYSLAELIKRVEPLGSAKYVEFVTLADKAVMPG